MAQVHGHCDPRFSKLRDLLHQFIESGQDIGASLCVNLDGNPDVVDIWGGYANPDTKTPWAKDTIVNVFSTTKLVTNLAATILISKGLIYPEDKVAHHWPGFAANGKGNITVAQVLSHTTGLCAWQDDMTLQDVCNYRNATRKLEEQKPLWEPGTAMGYHGLTQGFLVGELVKKTTGMSIDEFVTSEICQPLGPGADFQLGCREEHLKRVSPVIPPPGPSIQEMISQQPGFSPDSIVRRTICNPPLSGEDANSSLWRSSVLPSVNGHTNARGLVRIMSCFSLGGICAPDGHRLVSPETIELALEEHATGMDLVTGGPGRRGLGIYLTGPGSGVENKFPGGRVGWGSGWGGSFVVVDAERKLTMAYTMNRMLNGEHPSAAAFVQTVYEILGVDLA